MGRPGLTRAGGLLRNATDRALIVTRHLEVKNLTLGTRCGIPSSVPDADVHSPLAELTTMTRSRLSHVKARMTASRLMSAEQVSFAVGRKQTSPTVALEAGD